MNAAKIDVSWNLSGTQLFRSPRFEEQNSFRVVGNPYLTRIMEGLSVTRTIQKPWPLPSQGFGGQMLL